MSQNKTSLLGRLWSGLVSLLPGGNLGEDGPPPDIDGRRDADYDYKRAVLKVKSQMSSGGQATTTYESVDRTNAGGD